MKNPRKLVVRNEQDRRHAAYIIEHLDVSDENPAEVVFRPWRSTRSGQQNALYWKWLSIIAEETGHSKDDLHEQYKQKFLVPILIRDSQEFADMVAKVKNLRRKGLREEADTMRTLIVLNMSTAGLNVGQFTEYLNEIEQHAHHVMGIVLPNPEDK